MITMHKGQHLSEKNKQAFSRLGKHNSPEHIEKVRQAHLGKHLSEKHRLAFAYSQLGKPHSPEHNEKIGKGNLGKKRSLETKQKLREAHIGLHSGEKHPMYGKHHTEETKRKLRESHLGKHLPEEQKKKISESLRGEKNHCFGKHISEGHKQKISIANKGKKTWNTGTHGLVTISDEHKRKISETLRRKIHEGKIRINSLRPSGPELYIDFLLQNYFPDEWKYVGDGNTIINGLCPDFINCNGKKQIIEVFGEYWHKKRENLKYHSTEKGRKDIFAKVGFSTLVIWDYELADEKMIIEKIKDFIG